MKRGTYENEKGHFLFMKGLIFLNSLYQIGEGAHVLIKCTLIRVKKGSSKKGKGQGHFLQSKSGPLGVLEKWG